MIDPADEAQVSAALEQWVGQNVSRGRLTRPPSAIGRGFDTNIYGFAVTDADDAAWNADLVLRLYGAPGHAAKARHEAAAQSFAADAGYPALAPLAIEDVADGFGLPVMILPFVPGGTMLQRIAASPLQTGKLLVEMAHLHARLHRLPIEGCPLREDEPHAIRQIRALRRRAAPVIETAGLEAALQWLDDRLEMSTPEQSSLTHNDFHPLNLLARPDGGFVVIDWSDATVGDRACDVARTVTLLSFAYIAASSRAERLILKAARGFLRVRYLNAYEREYPLDSRSFAWWRAEQAVAGWVQLLELARNRSSGETVTAAAAAVPPGVVDEARRYVLARMDEAARLV